ncbi:MAG: hypothetical protein GY839_10005 [candidate division Zixibacteria bacterium]|nr:hypothetical protein [candidate division Zixibacteria bacterium]
MFKLSVISTVFVFVMFTSVSAMIINIPVDQPTIQEGIDASSDGDTVLVQPGLYYENIEFEGQDIVLGSLFLTTRDTSYISSTIIDGDSSGTVVYFSLGEYLNTILTGFTIQNGFEGPGIFCYNFASPTISYNRIRYNTSSSNGAGIYCKRSKPTISFNIIEYNSSGGEGGGISCRESGIYLNDNIISNNEAATDGGGIFNSRSLLIATNNIVNNNSANSLGGGVYCVLSNSIFINNIIYENSAGTYGGGMVCNTRSYPIISNSIIWSNTAGQGDNEIYVIDNSMPTISYSNVEGGWYGEGNINTDPLFRDPVNGDFHLMAFECGDPMNSPCIDTGNPHILDDLVDCSNGLGETISDIGAYGGKDSVVYEPEIILVPDDYSTIQEAINNSHNGDTILVSPGTYYENIIFYGHNIVLGSMFLTTGDSSYIASTVLDGDSLESVIILRNGEDTNTAVIGFTIKNGQADGCGGGVDLFFSKSTIRDNIITGNRTSSHGGGICCWYGGGHIVNNLIVSNEAGTGGGVYYYGAYVDIIGNKISNNVAFNSGGGIDNISFGVGMIRDNYINGNSCGNGLGGGGIVCESDTILNNIIINNTSAGEGGGILCGGRGFVISNLVLGNSAFIGGGVFLGGYATLRNSTIIGNIAQYDGGGIYCLTFQESHIANTICRLNSPNEIGVNEVADPVVSFCNIKGGYEGEGNIDCDPIFCDTAEGDYHIADASCCAGAGDGGVDIGALGVGCSAGTYMMGDANMYNGAWPPAVVGGDVTYLVNYFRSLPSSQQCLLDGFWSSADANGDCLIIGSDVTRIVNYFKGNTDISYCPDNPPAWLVPDDLPIEAPAGWPSCE